MLRRSLALLLLALGLAAVPRPADATPSAESALSGVVQVVAGMDHACALLDTGQVRCWGRDNTGQLGNGGEPSGLDQDEPVAVVSVTGTGRLTQVTQLSAGIDTTCARLASGRAVCWGDGGNGQLGDGQVSSRPRPTTVLNPAGTAPLTGVARVGVGEDHACAVLTSGQARCWGENTEGQLGVGDVFGETTGLPLVVLNGGGTGPLTGVTQIAAERAHTCAVVSGGARCWGAGDFGQLGNDDTEDSTLPVVVVGVTGRALTGVSQVTVGDQVSCARQTTGRAVCWGLGDRLGDGTRDDASRPGVVADPSGDDDLGGVAGIEAGDTHTCARLTGGGLRCWGNNAEGQLGDGTIETRHLPVATRNALDTAGLRNVVGVDTGSFFTCAALANGQARCWGTNTHGQLGDDGNAGDESHLPVVVHLR
jgi:alpha-tubulin suppressor-like RCC1 family protein